MAAGPQVKMACNWFCHAQFKDSKAGRKKINESQLLCYAPPRWAWAATDCTATYIHKYTRTLVYTCQDKQLTSGHRQEGGRRERERQASYLQFQLSPQQRIWLGLKHGPIQSDLVLVVKWAMIDLALLKAKWNQHTHRHSNTHTHRDTRPCDTL